MRSRRSFDAKENRPRLIASLIDPVEVKATLKECWSHFALLSIVRRLSLDSSSSGRSGDLSISLSFHRFDVS